ncbi:response regulator [Mesoterricola sediminis]|uniref:Response regulatory domain-containing protein n=1 Tax=Mesoterricola sediminis TaxID=2927980 RepID=A0AA48H6L1_9BACT|nr:response regulator [Mesoterricola sediminis]BDU78316.1 hypothetical protein METESE_32740 [Mesoterricola sediminis]
MPRLLLVDDNQRIHQIVETLLAATDLQLTCASSGAEALDLAAAGGFDAALVDAILLDMDGWDLMERLRAAPATARMPIAMMAGVLDTVDLGKVDAAPIQGFLRKPVDFHDIADRVRALMAVPVPAPASPDLTATVPGLRLADHRLAVEDDLLLLEPGDVLEEPAAAEAPADGLELEELDLESLKGLNLEGPAVEDAGAPLPLAEPPAAAAEGFLDFTAEDTLPEAAQEVLPDLGPSLDLPLEALPGEEEPALHVDVAPHLSAPTPVSAIPADWSDESDTLLDLGRDEVWKAPAPPEPEPAADPIAGHSDFDSDSFLDQDAAPEATPAFLPDLPGEVTPPTLPPEAEAAPEPPAFEPEPTPALGAIASVLAAAGAVAVAAPAEAPAETPAEVPAPATLELPPAPAPAGHDPLAALLADPVLMDRLAKAVAARLGNDALREVAWEVMPELAERIGRP